MATEIYTLKVEGTLNEQYRANVFHFLGTGVDTNDTYHAAGDLLTAFDTHLHTLWLACLPASYYLAKLTARRTRLKPTASRTLTYGYGFAPGTRGTTATAFQTCPCIFEVPRMLFPSGGRIYMPAIAQADLADGSYQAAYVTAVQNFMGAAIGGSGGVAYTWKLQIYSYKTGSYSDIMSYYLSPFIGFVKKRKLLSGRGTHKKKP